MVKYQIIFVVAIEEKLMMLKASHVYSKSSNESLSYFLLLGRRVRDEVKTNHENQPNF